MPTQAVLYEHKPRCFMFTHKPEVCAFYILVPIWRIWIPVRFAPERWKYRVEVGFFLFRKREHTQPLGTPNTAPPFLSYLLLRTVDSLRTPQAGGVLPPDPLWGWGPGRSGTAAAGPCPEPACTSPAAPCAAARWLCFFLPFWF